MSNRGYFEANKSPILFLLAARNLLVHENNIWIPIGFGCQSNCNAYPSLRIISPKTPKRGGQGNLDASVNYDLHSKLFLTEGSTANQRTISYQTCDYTWQTEGNLLELITAIKSGEWQKQCCNATPEGRTLSLFSSVTGALTLNWMICERKAKILHGLSCGIYLQVSAG